MQALQEQSCWIVPVFDNTICIYLDFTVQPVIIYVSIMRGWMTPMRNSTDSGDARVESSPAEYDVDSEQIFHTNSNVLKSTPELIADETASEDSDCVLADDIPVSGEDFLGSGEYVPTVEEDALLDEDRAPNPYEDADSRQNTTTRKRRQYQTRFKAGDVDTIIPEMVIPTSRRNVTAFSLHPSLSTSHLIVLTADAPIHADGGSIRINGGIVSDIHDLDAYIQQDISGIDLRPLRIIYGSIVQKLRPLLDMRTWNFEEIDTFGLRIFLPDLLAAMGVHDRRNTNRVFAVLESYQHLVGLFVPEKGKHSINTVLLIKDRDTRSNTVCLVSPYLNRIALNAYLGSLRYRDNGRTLVCSPQEIPERKATDSYLIKGTIASAKNLRAVEIVCIIVTLLEQAGNRKAHIKASNIVSRHPELSNALGKARSNKQRNMILQRAFGGAWEILLGKKGATDSAGDRFTRIPEKLCVLKIEAYRNDGKEIGRRKAQRPNADNDSAEMTVTAAASNETVTDSSKAEVEPTELHTQTFESPSMAEEIVAENHVMTGKTTQNAVYPPVPTVTTLDSLIYTFYHRRKQDARRK